MDDLLERAYLLTSAKRERAMASRCNDSSTALAHARMAEEYERRAGLTEAPKPV